MRSGLSRIGTLEHEADICWLGKKLKELKGELNKVKQLPENTTPIKYLDEIGLLLTQEGNLDEKRDKITKKLLAEAVKDEDKPCYQAEAEKSLLERLCAYFAFEIKTNQPMRDILEKQLLAKINLKAEDLEKSLEDVARDVQQVVTKLDNLGLAIGLVGSKVDGLKGSLEEVMEVVSAIAGNVQQIKKMLEQLLQGKQYTPRPILKIVLPDEVTPQQLSAAKALVQQASGDVTIEFLGSKKGSIVLFFEASQEGFERLEALYRSGQLAEILGVPVLEVPSIAEDTLVERLVNLSQWMQKNFVEAVEAGWQTIEEIFGPRMEKAFRDGTEKLARQIDLGAGQIVALVVVLSEVENQEIRVVLRVSSTVRETYLPENLKFRVIPESGDTREISSGRNSGYLEQEWFYQSGERFSVILTLNDVSVTENFVI